MEVRFYDDWSWGDYMGGNGYASTLDIKDDSPKNPIGFLAEIKSIEDRKIIQTNE